MTDKDEPQRRLEAESHFAVWASRVEAGEPLGFEELVRANPTLERELRELHDDWKHFAPILGNVVPGLIASGDGLVLPSLTCGPDVDDGPPSDELLAKLGIHAPDNKRYRFRGRIGRGGQGVVLKVWDTKLNRPLAMKLVLGRAEDQPTGQTPRVDGRRLTRFVDEARIASQLNHPGIVPVHELGADETGRAFFTMKLVKGDDLARIFEKVKSGEAGWTQVRAVNYLLRVCEAMAYAHDRGVIHRDLKPANIMVGAYGEVHVMDWGLARVVGEHAPPPSVPSPPKSQVDSVRRTERVASPESPLVTGDGDAVGTPNYMSPEQARGDLAAAGPATDIYALGAMLYQLLTGEPPYLPGNQRLPPAVVVMNVLHGPPKPVEEITPRAIPELVAICEHAMAREPSARYASMSALAMDLQAFLDGRVVSAYESGAWAEGRKWVRRNKTLATTLFTAVVLTFGGAASLAVQTAKARKNAIQALGHQRAAEAESYLTSIVAASSALARSDGRLARRVLDGAPPSHRRWEWDYLNAEADTSMLSIVADIGYGGSVKMSACGDSVLAIMDGKTASVWTASSGQLIRSTTLAEGTFRWVEIDSASKSALTLTSNQEGWRLTASTLDAGTQRWSVPVPEINTICLTANGGVIVAEVGGYESRWLAWDAMDGRQVHPPSVALHELEPSMSASGRQVHGGAYAEDFVELTAGSENSPPLRLLGHVANIIDAAIHDNDTRVVAASDDGCIKVWDVTNRRSNMLRLDHGLGIKGLAISSDSTRIAAGDDERTIVWDLESGEQMLELRGHNNPAWTIQFSADNSIIATSAHDQYARIWDAASGRQLAALGGPDDGNVTQVVLAPSGKRAVTIGLRGRPAMWDTLGGVKLYELSAASEITAIGQSSDGSRLLAGCSDGTVAVIGAADGAPIRTLSGHSDAVMRVSFSPDDSLVATASSDRSLRIWSGDSGALRAVLPMQSDSLRFMCFSRDSSQLVTSSGNSTANVWDMRTGDLVIKLVGHRMPLHDAQFSADGTRVFTSSADKTVRVWDVASGFQLLVLEGHADFVGKIALDSSGQRLVTASDDGTVRVWDSQPFAARARWHDAMRSSASSAKIIADTAIQTTGGFESAARQVRGDALLTPSDRNATLNNLTRRAALSWGRLQRLSLLSGQRDWTQRMLGRTPWPALTAHQLLTLEGSLLSDNAEQLRVEAERLMGVETQRFGEEVLALLLAERALHLRLGSALKEDTSGLTAYRGTLASAFVRNGRFDDALMQIREFEMQFGPSRGACSLCGGPHHDSLPDSRRLHEAKSELAKWRDDAGRLQIDEWNDMLADIECEVAELSGDPDVQIWLREHK